MAESPSNNDDKDNSPLEKPVPPPMQSVIKGGWTYRIENPTETVISALKELAQEVRRNSWAFVRQGPAMLSPSVTALRDQKIKELAKEIDRLGDKVPHRKVTYGEVKRVLDRLHELGFFPDQLLISNVARAIYALGQRRTETGVDL